MEQVFDFKKGREPWKKERKTQYGWGLDSDIEKIIKDVNEPKSKPMSGMSGTSGSSNAPVEKKERVRKIVNIDEVINDNVYQTHEDYLDYLEMTYEGDNGCVVKPDFIWFTILSELTQYINTDPDRFRKYFTTSDKKEKISVAGEHKNGYVDIRLDLLTEKVLQKIPSNFTEDLIIPQFSTLTDNSKLAFMASFLESMSNYYTFGAVACGFSKIKVLGTIEDYQLMISTLNKIIGIIPEFTDYLNVCISAIEEIIKYFDNKYFWHYICWTEHGYGVNTVDGWFTKFFRIYDGSVKSTNEFNKHIAKVPYIHEETGDEYITYLGIFTSTYEDGCYVPDFTKIVTRYE